MSAARWLFPQGDGEGKTPGTVKETSGLDKAVRRMAFPAQEIDPRDDGYGERAFKNRINFPFLIGSECPRKIIDQDIRIDKKSGHARFHSFRRDSDTPFGSLMISRQIPKYSWGWQGAGRVFPASIVCSQSSTGMMTLFLLPLASYTYWISFIAYALILRMNIFILYSGNPATGSGIFSGF